MVVLVVYKMEINESPAFISLTKALQSGNHRAAIFIYDNSPRTHTHTQNQNWIITYRNDPGNPGVSKAYNEGFELAKSQNKKWILLVDQDTEFPIDAFDRYQKCLRKLNSPIIIPKLIDRIGIASPLKFYFGGGQRQKDVQTDQFLNLNDYFFHNSGLLISTDAFEKAGKYDENLPLDFSDFSFVHRLRKKNNSFAVASITCTHHLATTSGSGLNERLQRFAIYLKAGHYFKGNYQPRSGWLAFRFFLRAIKLTYQYRNFQFLVLYFRLA